MDIKGILRDPVKRRELFVRCIQSMQNMEGIDTTREQAEHAYDTVQAEVAARQRATGGTRRAYKKAKGG